MTSDQLDVPETQSANIKTTTADEKDANGSPCGRRIGAVVRRAELPGDLDGVRHQQVVVGVEDLGLVTAVLSNQQRIDVVLVDVLESVQSSVVVMTLFQIRRPSRCWAFCAFPCTDSVFKKFLPFLS